MDKEMQRQDARHLLDRLNGLAIDPYLNLEAQYVRKILETIIDWKELPDRTGTGILSGGNVTFKLNLKKDHYEYINFIPKLIGRKVYPKLALGEILWFMQGKTDKETLNKYGVKYWDKFFLEDGTIGKSYGYQFRSGNDQLLNVVSTLKHNPTSRRILLDLWNKEELKDMALPPCFYSYLFSATEELREEFDDETIDYEMQLVVNSRSADAFLGVPYNFMTSYMFAYMCLEMANHNNLTQLFLGKIVWDIANFHIYLNHIEQCLEYCENFISNPVHEDGKSYSNFSNYMMSLSSSEMDKAWNDAIDVTGYINNYLEARTQDLFRPDGTPDWLDHKYCFTENFSQLRVGTPKEIKAELSV